MKKILSIILILSFIISGCDDDDYKTGVRAPAPFELSERVQGRVVGAYVTHYGKSIPDPTMFTNLYYSFAEIYMDNGEYKGFKVQGNEERFKQIVQLKEANPDLKISIAFANLVENSDNKHGGGFSALAKSDEYRKKFAQDCKDFLNQWGIDGVDMDWEFPGLTWSDTEFDDAVDVENHVLLMKQLRETLGSQYLLTYAGYAKNKEKTANGWKYIDVKAVDQYIDFVNIMTYDLGAAPSHQSALNAPSAPWDCYRAVQSYLDAGVSPSKLVLGIPFYGRISFGSGGSITYGNIQELSKEYEIDNWDEVASVPYVTKNGVYYCGYDNPRSIKLKGDWLLSKGMKGMMYWDYDGDDAKSTLRKATWEAVMQPVE